MKYLRLEEYLDDGVSRYRVFACPTIHDVQNYLGVFCSHYLRVFHDKIRDDEELARRLQSEDSLTAGLLKAMALNRDSLEEGIEDLTKLKESLIVGGLGWMEMKALMDAYDSKHFCDYCNICFHRWEWCEMESLDDARSLFAS